VLGIIEDFWRERGVAPSLSELASRVGVRKSTVHEHVLALERKGFIDHIAGASRTWKPRRLQGRESSYPRIPVVGRIAAGEPSMAEEDIEGWIPFEDTTRGGHEYFALKVRGDSMSGVGILDDDLVIVRRQDAAQDGDIVVALIDGDEATVKRLRCEDGVFRLVAENPAYGPIAVETDGVRVQGKVVGLRRVIA
jgi:repressor LexA